MTSNHTIYGSSVFIDALEYSIRESAQKIYSGSIKKSTKIMEGNKLDIQVTDRNRSYGDSRIYRYKINGESVLRFDQIPYPECCGIAIIKNFSANGDMQKADFLDAMDQFLADIKKNDRYSKVLFYTNAGSNGDRMFSMINGITILDPFKNKRSGNTLVGFEIDLLDKATSLSWRDEISESDFDEEETDGEHDEDEGEDDDPFEIRLADQNMQETVEAQAILNGGPQPVASQRGDATQAARPVFGNGFMEQISPQSRRVYLNDPWENF